MANEEETVLANELSAAVSKATPQVQLFQSQLWQLCYMFQSHLWQLASQLFKEVLKSVLGKSEFKLRCNSIAQTVIKTEGQTEGRNSVL